jgi:hypothetical protein
MSLAYYASRLSDNIGETPEGFLVCRDVVIGRTGWQTYNVGDLPADAAAELGVDLADPSAPIEVYRSQEEVFDPTTIASFEGKSLTDGHPPAAQFVDPNNVLDYEFGHIQNVRRGDNPLPTGDWPMIADFIIKREPLIGAVRDDVRRETSCGYDYTLARDSAGRLCQTEIRGNHVAVVPRGRAGAVARIVDAAEPSRQERAGGGSTGKSEGKDVPVKTNILQRILGLGFQAFAKDAAPEEVAEAAQALKEHEHPKTEEKAAADTRKADDEAEKKPEFIEKKEEKKEEPKAEDAKGKDRRAKFHATLDRMLDETEEDPDGIETAKDADIEELRELLDEFLEEEEGEPEHEGEEGGEQATDCEGRDAEFFTNPAGYTIPIRNSSGYKRSKAGEGRKSRRRARDANFIEPVGEATEKASDLLETLRKLRPVVARSKDAAVRAAFNEAIQSVQGRGKGAEGKGGYSAFAGAARQRAADTAPGSGIGEQAKKLQSFYDQARTGKEAK